MQMEVIILTLKNILLVTLLELVEMMIYMIFVSCISHFSLKVIFCNLFLNFLIKSYFIKFKIILGLQLGRVRPGSNPAKVDFNFFLLQLILNFY